MPVLNQIVALEKGVKSRSLRSLTDIYHRLERKEPIAGISKTYTPSDEEGEQLPAETTRVQVRAEEELVKIGEALTDLFDVTATKEYGNTDATGDVVVDGVILLEKVPVGYLLFLEKQLTDLHTVATKLPVLSEAQDWRFDPNQNCYAGTPVDTARTVKTPLAFVKAEATDKHPAQVEVVHKDIRVGTWRRIDYSGALPQQRVAEIVGRIEALQDAVKIAREQANAQVVSPQKVAAKVFSYIFGKNGGNGH